MEKFLELKDDFNDDRREGSVIGTHARSGHRRSGVDVEKVLSIDNGALRIAPLIEAGFGRAGISYGPFLNHTGLAFAVNILNGHNTAQAESLPDTFRERLGLWLAGSGTDPKWTRVRRWLCSGRIHRTLRQFRWWKRSAKDSRPVPALNENLAVGWFPAEVVQDPRIVGNGFIMHALGPENGELVAGGNGHRIRALRGVQNIPLYLVAVLQNGGIVYYVSSVRGGPGTAAHPHYQPVAVEKTALPEELYFGIQQGVLGQIGWRLDTRIKEVRVACVAGYDAWCGGAHTADRLTGAGGLDGSRADVGGQWKVLCGGIQRAESGIRGSDDDSMAIIDPGAPSGLIHAELPPRRGGRSALGFIWRYRDRNNHWRMELEGHACAVLAISNGERRILAERKYPHLSADRPHCLQVLDSGTEIMAYVDGEPVAESWLRDEQLVEATGVGVFLGGSHGEAGEGAIKNFEAHPRQIDLPNGLALSPPWVRKGSRLVIADDFEGPAGDLEKRPVKTGDRIWRRVIGKGVIATTGDRAACVQGSVENPCPGRTAYCMDWETPDFADLEVTITPPGTGRGGKERGIAGIILYQDDDNYVTLNIWRTDYYGGASISTFFKYRGFEDLYDAIWTNVGDRVYYGRPCRLRVCCDGEQYLVFVNDEPVLYRAFRDVYPDFARLRLHKIGLLANWEFGNDTGSRFEGFRARI